MGHILLQHEPRFDNVVRSAALFRYCFALLFRPIAVFFFLELALVGVLFLCNDN